MADHIKRIIDEYNAGKPWYDINGDEISLDDFINIYEEEKAYEEKSMGSFYGNGKAH